MRALRRGPEADLQHRRSPSSRSRARARRRRLPATGALGVLLAGVLLGGAGAAALVPAAPDSTLAAEAAPSPSAAVLDVDGPRTGIDGAVAGEVVVAPTPEPSPAPVPSPAPDGADEPVSAAREQSSRAAREDDEAASDVPTPADAAPDVADEVVAEEATAEPDADRTEAPADDQPASDVPTPAAPSATASPPTASPRTDTAATDAPAIERAADARAATATSLDRADLVDAVTRAQERIDALTPILLDPLATAGLSAEVEAAEAVLSRWTPESVRVPELVQLTGAPVSLLETVPTAGAVADRLASLAAALDALPSVETVDGVTYIDGVLVANKTIPLPADYDPGLSPDLVAAFDAMVAAARADGISLWIASGYRSYADQTVIYDRYAARVGAEAADTFSARPGHSEHQSGLAIDVNDVSSDFAGTAAAQWVAQHGHEFGFVVRYPEGKESVTGYSYEPWHLRYVGVEVAGDLVDQGLTLEEYLGVTSGY
ncbi:LAS superfamily LD-carboxypeptidase LdcB [Salana multivorans]|uniref:LAS superfamily LD-carboxypeptidase LdcB n=1 Tax=Salana multivorans TaxID=120377 RepID=A0A3N2D292_9MICO|nr:M15 family metallopeptidase [Salana multivorans]ROR93893.1 LAS superfamily LD-carboxypeptidase LdcB [Salana multivorans]